MILFALYILIGVAIAIGLVRIEKNDSIGAPEMIAIFSPVVIIGWPILIAMAIIYVLGTGEIEYPL